MILRVEKPGLLTTVQDLGRRGWQAYGLPAAGAADALALQLANLLVGNPPGEAALEITLAGPAFRVEEGGCFAVTGADMEARLGGRPLPLWETSFARTGDEISFGWAKRGARAYLAVPGGIDVPVVMGSRSTYLRCRIGGLEGRALRAGDRIGARAAREPVRRRIPAPFVPAYGSPWTVRVVMGPQEDRFTPAGIAAFVTGEYRATRDCDRMGCRLAGPVIAHRPGGADIVSDGTPPGAIQVPGNGQPVVLLADCQTTGGYAKIATVISSDLWQAAQAKPGDMLRFRPVSLEEAQALYRRAKERFAALDRWLQTGVPTGQEYRVFMEDQAYHILVEEDTSGK